MCFSLHAGPKMFQFPALAPYIVRWHVFNIPGCPIRKSADQGLFAPPRSLSQLITSVGSLHRKVACLQHTGLSHSEIRGSRVICTSPQLIAAYHVHHRLREPRHPTCPLSYFPYHVHAHLAMRAGCYILLAFVLKLLLLVTSCHRPFLLWRITDSNR